MHFQKSFGALFLTSLLLTGSIASLKEVSAQLPQAPKINEVTTNTFVQDELYFGRNKPTGQVSERDFQLFLQNEVTPRFPDGLTVLDADGQFLGSSGIIKEKTKLLILIHSNSQADRQEIQEIIEEYKNKFQQESVLRVTSTPEQVRF